VEVGAGGTSGKTLGAGVDSLVTELLLDTEKLVVLGNTLRSAWSTGLDLTGLKTNSEVGNVGRLGLTGSVRGHDTPAVGLSELNSLDRLGNGTNLVDLRVRYAPRVNSP